MSQAKFELAEEIVRQIDAYLDGSCAGAEVCRWAAKQLGANQFASGELLLETALSSLVGVGWPDPQYDTPRAELIEIRAALVGEGDYKIALRWVPLSEIERARQSHRA